MSRPQVTLEPIREGDQPAGHLNDFGVIPHGPLKSLKNRGVS